MPKISVGESFTVALISVIEKVSIRGGGGEYRDFLSKSFCLTVPKISVGLSFIVALVSGTGEVCRRRGEYQDFPSKIFLSCNAENFRRGILYCCINFGYRKSLDKRGGEYQYFLSKSFCLTVPKISVGLSFVVALVSGTGKVCRRRGGVSSFSVEIFLSHSAENFRRGIPYCCINFGYRKSLDKRGGEYQDFQSKSFCLTVPKISVGNPLLLH